MANAWYPKFKELAISLACGVGTKPTGTLKCTLVDLADYTYSAAHDFYDDVGAPARVATATLASPTFTNGTFDAADFTFTAATGDPSEALIYWLDTGVAATSPLILFIDTGQTGLPVTPSGADLNMVLHASGIASI